MTIRPHDVQALHQLGARALLELLKEIAARHGEKFVAARLGAYAQIDPAAIDAVNGRDILPAPIREIAV